MNSTGFLLFLGHDWSICASTWGSALLELMHTCVTCYENGYRGNKHPLTLGAILFMHECGLFAIGYATSSNKVDQMGINIPWSWLMPLTFN